MTVKEWRLELIRGALAPKKFYWMQNRTTPYDLTGKTAKLRIKPEGAAEIEVAAPMVDITDPANGEITIAFTDEAVAGYGWKRAIVALQVGDRILKTGKFRIKEFHE